MRLDKFISHALGKTRSEARDIIKQGQITVNQTIMRKNDWTVDEYHDAILFHDQPIVFKNYLYLMLNKPMGYLSATKDQKYPTVIDLIKEYENYDLFMAGRLDLDSEGLMIITNDGKFAHGLTSPRHEVPKKYYVKTDAAFSEADVLAFQEGLFIYDGHKNRFKTQPAVLKIISPQEANVTIAEGKYHQVKKMCLKVGKNVTYLKRLAMGELELDPNLKTGEYRLLSVEEIDRLKETVK